MKGNKKWRTAGLSLLLAALAAFCAAIALPALARTEAAQPRAYEGILRVWHIDGFEGGKGSRASFLSRAARAYEGEREGLLLMVSAHTPESAAAALAEGRVPDMISYGGGCGFVADYARPLAGADCPAASFGGRAYGAAWCRGGYLLFTAEGDFSDISADNTLLSEGRGGCAAAAAALEGWRGGFACLPSAQAYRDFAAGKYRYMLGTQRDVQRFLTLGVQVRCKPLDAYCDLFQYISVCTEDEGRYAACLGFISLLCGEEWQKNLTQIGMLGVHAAAYREEGGILREAEEAVPLRVFPAFADEEAREAFAAAARAALAGDENGVKKLENYLV